MVNYRPKQLKDHTLLGDKASKEESTLHPPPPHSSTPLPPLTQNDIRLFLTVFMSCCHAWSRLNLSMGFLGQNIVLLITILFCIKIEPSICSKKRTKCFPVYYSHSVNKKIRSFSNNFCLFLFFESFGVEKTNTLTGCFFKKPYLI